MENELIELYKKVIKDLKEGKKIKISYLVREHGVGFSKGGHVFEKLMSLGLLKDDGDGFILDTQYEDKPGKFERMIFFVDLMNKDELIEEYKCLVDSQSIWRVRYPKLDDIDELYNAELRYIKKRLINDYETTYEIETEVDSEDIINLIVKYDNGIQMVLSDIGVTVSNSNHKGTFDDPKIYYDVYTGDETEKDKHIYDARYHATYDLICERINDILDEGAKCSLDASQESGYLVICLAGGMRYRFKLSDPKIESIARLFNEMYKDVGAEILLSFDTK